MPSYAVRVEDLRARWSRAVETSHRLVAPFTTAGDGRRLRLALLLVFVFWVIAAASWPLRDLVIPWDSKNQFFVFYRFMADSLHRGWAPFWNPYHYGGHPSIADPQSLIFSPAFLLWAAIDPDPSLFAFDAMVFAHLLVGGFALVFYGRRHGWPTAASVLAAMVFMIGGAVSGRMNHVGIITTYAVFPVALWWMEVALAERSRRAAIGLGFASALLVLGRSQVPLLLCAVLAGLTVHHLVSRPDRLAYLRSRLPVLAIAGAVTLALVTVPMLLTLQFADLSNRPEIDIETALRSSLYPVNFADLFVPDVFGSLRPLSEGNWGPGFFTRPEVDATDRAFNYLFAGSLPALLAWWGVVGGRAFRPGARAFTVVAIAAALYAVGRYTPVFPFLYRHVPGVDLFRRPVGGTFIFGLALAYLTGWLATTWVREGLRPLSRPALLLGAAVLTGLLVWAIAFSARTGHAGDAARQIALALPIYGGLILLARWPATETGRTAALALAVAFTGGELLLRNVATPLNADPRIVYSMLEQRTPEAARVVDAIRDDMSHHPSAVRRPRVEVLGLGGPWQNAAMLYDLEAINGYNPLRIGAYDRLVSPGEEPHTLINRRFQGAFPNWNCLLGRLLGLRYVVLDRPLDKVANLKRRMTAEVVMAGPKVWIYRLPDAFPRVALESRVVLAESSAFVAADRFPATIDDRAVLIDGADPISQNYSFAPLVDPGRAEIVDWRPDRVEIAVETRAPAVLTLHDLWYPGWEAEVDGVRRPILRADILFRGVEIPAGARKVVFTYRPFSLENLRAAAVSVLWPRHPRRPAAPSAAPAVTSPSDRGTIG